MKQGTKHTDHKSRARTRIWRAAPVAGVVVGVGLLASGFGGGSRKDPGGGPGRAQAINQAGAFSGCMRAHGLPGFPNPQVSGAGGNLQAKITVHRGFAGGVNTGSPAFNTALQACRKLLPTGSSQSVGSSTVTQAQSHVLRFAGCMRANGMPDFPNPQISSSAGSPQVHTATAHRGSGGGLNPSSPAFTTALRACASVQSNTLSSSQSRG